MAIAHVATATSQTANNQTNTSITVTLGSTTAGHLNVIEVAVKVDGTGVDPVIATPAGWTAITSEAFDSGTTSSIGMRAFYRFFVGGDSSTVSVTWTNAGNGVAISSGYSGVNTSTPITGFQVEAKGTTDTSYSVSVTTSQTGWIRSGFANRGGQTFSALADTSRGSVLNTSATSMVAQDTAADVAAGTYTKTATGSGTTSIGAEWAYGLNSAGGGGAAFSWTITDTTSLSETLTTSSLATVDTYTDGLGLTDTVTRVLSSTPSTDRVADFTFEVELAPTATPATSGPSYVDVTSYVRLVDSATLTRGRENEGSTDAQPGRASWTMDNSGGVFTPGDTGSPFAPFQLRRPFRWSVTVDNISYPLWQGFLDATETYRDGVYARARLSCSDRLAQAARTSLGRLTDAEFLTDSPYAFWPLRDLTASTGVTISRSLNYADSTIVGGTVGFSSGDSADGNGDAVAVFDRASSTSGRYLRDRNPVAGASNASHTVECFVKPSGTGPMVFAAATDLYIDGVSEGLNGTTLGMDSSNRLVLEVVISGTPTRVTSTATIPSDTWTHVAYTTTSSGSTVKLYIGGVLDSTTTLSGLPGFVYPYGYINVGGHYSYSSPWNFWGPMNGAIADFVHTGSILTATRIAAHASAAAGYAGEAAPARFARIMAAASVPADGYIVSGTSNVALGAQRTYGSDPVTNVNEIAAADGGFSYATALGAVKYATASSRYNAPTALTIDAAKTGQVLAGTAFTTDNALLLNVVTYSAADGWTSTATDSTSVANYGRSALNASIIASSHDATASVANWTLATRSTPASRSNSIDINVVAFRASGGDIGALLNLDIGSRITVFNLPDDLAPGNTLDLFVEGITDRIDKASWVRSLTTSPVGIYASVFTLDSASLGLLNTNVLGL